MSRSNLERACPAIMLAFVTSFAGCSCEGDPLQVVKTPDAGFRDASPFDDAAEVPDTGPEIDDAGECIATGVVAGRVCSPSNRDWVAGAVVTLAATDCHGQAIALSATSGMDGSFQIDRVPAGHWTITANAGAFTHSYQVDVQDGQTTTIPDDQLCVTQQVKIAVVTGAGDHIETLLTNVGVMFDSYDGASGYATSAAPFLTDLNRMKTYDLIFFDCAAGAAHSQVNLGSNSARITQNIRQYVMDGGSVYGSDWAVAILALAFPDIVRPQLMNGGMVSDPFSTNQLIGYAPQTVNAQVMDQGLASAINTNSVSISFPDQTGARSSHWGLIGVPGSNARVLVQSHVKTCMPGAMYCDMRGSPGASVLAPLAINFKLTAQGQRGGNVFYTSFHNIAQQGNDVANILKYIVFHL